MPTMIRLDPNALKTVLEQDPEFVLEIRTAALNTALKHMIKAVMPGEIQKDLLKAAREEARAEIFERKNWKYVLMEEVRAHIRNEIRDEYQRLVREEVQRVRDEVMALISEKTAGLAEYYASVAEESADRAVNAVFRNAVTNHIKEAIDAKMNTIAWKGEHD